MMRLTIGAKHISLRLTTIILMLLVMLGTFSCATVDGWKHDNNPNAVLSEGDSCSIRDGAPGICTRIENCEPYIDGLHKKTIQYSSLVRCSFIGTAEVICCSAGTTVPTTKTVDTLMSRNQNDRPSQAACHRYRDNNPATLNPRILDGLPVEPGDYPHMGGLIFPDGGVNSVEVRCGSSLISERYVMTAAHCVNDPVDQPIKVRFGVVVWNSTDSGIEPYDAEIEEIILHPEYISYLKYHDIALIRLRKNVPFGPYIRPACLNTDLADLDSAIKLAVIGWGVTNIDTKVRSTVLLSTNLITVGLQECNATHEADGFTPRYEAGLNAGQYCAFDPELRKSACQADSGGPLQLVKKQQSTIVGIVSFGSSCGTAIPAVYVRVAFYLPWIESIVWLSYSDGTSAP